MRIIRPPPIVPDNGGFLGLGKLRWHHYAMFAASSFGVAIYSFEPLYADYYSKLELAKEKETNVEEGGKAAE
jgi:cytochrome c oxidase assembly factor CtaG